jgi:hypothetical protein
MSESDEERSMLRRALAPRLGDLGTPLELVAEDVLGEEDGSIDWVAAAPDGRAFVVLVADRCGDAALLQAGLVQRAWVESRIPDWRKLAPSLGLRDALAPHLLLVARDFARATRIAAREAAQDSITLARFLGDLTTGQVEIERVEPYARVARGMPAHAQRPASVFRTGLRDGDFAN